MESEGWVFVSQRNTLEKRLQLADSPNSFGATGIISCIIGFYVLPEIARRTPAEIDEMFEAKISPRKFSKYHTQVQTFLEEKENVERGNLNHTEATP